MKDVKRLAEDIKIYDLAGNLLRTEARVNFPKKRKRRYLHKAEKGEGGWQSTSRFSAIPRAKGLICGKSVK